MLGVLPVERLVRGAQRRRPGVRRWQLAHSRREAARTSAMTRARNELDLISPLKYYVTQQSRTGDAHVYGARSRFLTPGVMAAFDALVWPSAAPGPESSSGSALPRVDVAARLKGMWS